MDKLRAAYKVVVVIGLAMMASLVIYLVIVGLFENNSIELLGAPALSGNELEIMKFALIGASAVILFLIKFLGAKIMNAGAEQKRMTGSQAGGGAGVPAEFGPLVTAAVVTFSLCEVPAIFGLVLYFLGRNSADFYLFLLISLFLFATNFPKFSQWEEWQRRRQGMAKR